jgi:hypothetical protein
MGRAFEGGDAFSTPRLRFNIEVEVDFPGIVDIGSELGIALSELVPGFVNAFGWKYMYIIQRVE